ncbi:endo-1,4-beta-xylanase [Zunongwangia atlantica]|uniref:Beta-1,4-xylanase n=1 Tax=Zunongwangia atlantica 22II14-10F7 TaxID=1185767 RepID=A0A1Y1T139_9FLAO|nr:endo-1,4-beta-xylanase [Zunongwangia atlantica]ORL44748.1 beta-1,4-xylanase [Zunongwangia atlantica 22II14-10F7]
MKILNRFIILFVLMATMFSCEEAELDSEFESGLTFEKPVGVVNEEMVNTYDVLKSYAGELKIGANASLADLSDENMGKLVRTNFTQVTPLAGLNSSAILSDDGTYDFSVINNYINEATNKELSVYGDAIVSNLNQNASYLNSFGASITYSTPLFPNFVDQSVIADGTFTDWTVNGDISIEEYMGEQSVKLENDASVVSREDTSLQSPVYSVDEGAEFELTFYILSDQVGEGRVIFDGLNNNEPEMDWTEVDSTSTTFTTEIGWNKIQFQTTDFDDSGEFSFKIELGYTPNVTYFLNIEGLSLINLNGKVENPEEIFVEAEDGILGSEWQINSDADASGGMYVLANSAENYLTPNNPGSEPYYINYTINAVKAGTYTCWVRGLGPTASDDSFFLSVNGSPFTYGYWPLSSGGWKWTNIGTYNLTAGENNFAASIRENGFQIDRFYFTLTSNTPSGVGSPAISQSEVRLDVSEDVKKNAVQRVLKEYITNVYDELGDKVDAWTVVKEPFEETGSIAVSGDAEEETSYYWADFLGEDYIPFAFSTVREKAPESTKLFLSETNLDINSNERDAVINLLKANDDIDGVAVGLELNTESDFNLVENMFDELAATGKLIYVTDLKIVISENTQEAYVQQSALYERLVSSYKSNVPSEQQYGISLAEPVDNTAGLWDSGYNRKLPYAGFAIGLGAEE